MDQIQTNRVTMFKTVTAYLDKNNAVWSGMAPLVAAVQQFKDKIGAIETAAQKQETPTTGAALDKASARDGLEDVLFLTCEALAVLGHTSNDNELLATVDVTTSDLRNFGDEELSNRATTVLQKVNAKKAETTENIVVVVVTAEITEDKKK